MGEELDRQKSTLETLDTKVERDQAMLKDVNKKVGKMLGRKDPERQRKKGKKG